MKNIDIVLRIKELMKIFAVKQIEFSQVSGIGQANLSAILNGRRSVGSAIVNKIVLAYNVNKQWLLTGEGEIFNAAFVNEPMAVYEKVTSSAELRVYDAVKNLTYTNRELVTMYKQVIEDKRVLEEKVLDLVNKMIEK